jgi:hypothetical protein
MNEKIAELRNQAMETYTYSDCDGDNNRGTRLNPEKFAELIIQECAKIADDGFGSAYFGLGINGAMLKHHFGVK